MFGSERCAIFSHVGPGTTAGEPWAKLPITRPQLSFLAAPPHFNHRPDADINENQPEKPSAGDVEPEENRESRTPLLRTTTPS